MQRFRKFRPRKRRGQGARAKLGYQPDSIGQKLIPVRARPHENLDLPDTRPSREQIASGAYLLRGFALDNVTALVAEIERIETAAAFRHLETPGGFRMSVAMTNCGRLGWVWDAEVAVGSNWAKSRPGDRIAAPRRIERT